MGLISFVSNVDKNETHYQCMTI